MTNLESFNKGLIIEDDSFATIILNQKSIDPSGTDDNYQSLAWGFIYSVVAPDYTQGKTSEKLTSTAVSARISRGKSMLAELEIYYDDSSATEINTITW